MAQEGIMSLPQSPEMAAPQYSRADIYDAAKIALGRTDPQQLAEFQSTIQAVIADLNPTQEQLEMMAEMIEHLIATPEQYRQNLDAFIAKGLIDAGDLPEEYDLQVLSMFLVVLHELAQSGQAGMPMDPQMQMPMDPQMQMAEGGLADAAQYLQSQGRYGDSILAHINPQEAALLKRLGGAGTINPYTGLVEYGFFKSVFKSIGKAVKSIAQSPIFRTVATVVATAFGGPVVGALVSGSLTKVAGGSWKDALIAGGTAYFGSGGGIGGFNPSEIIGNLLPAGISPMISSGLTAGAIGTGAALLGGQNLSGALKSGLQAGVTSAASTGLRGMLDSTQAPAPVRDGRVSQPMVDPTTGAQTFPVSDLGAGIEARPLDATATAPIGAITTGNVENILTSGAQQPAPVVDRAVPPYPEGYRAPPRGTLDTIKDYMFRGGNTQAQVDQQKIDASTKAYTQAKASGVPEALAIRMAETAASNAGPGILTQYGPSIALGIGALGLGGGFKPKPIDDKPLGFDSQYGGTEYIRDNPSMFASWGGWKPPTIPSGTAGPMATMGPTPTTTPFSYYTVPPGAIGSGPTVAQPYNVAYPFRANVGGAVNNPGVGGGALDPMQAGMSFAGTNGYAHGGVFAAYPRRTGQIDGPGTATSDSIPALLSDGEFVMTAKAVRGMGNGNRRNGAKRMYQLMHGLEKGKRG